jgi:hypothetical protein
LLKTESCTLKPCVRSLSWVLGTCSSTILGCHCPTCREGMSNRAGDTFWSMGAWRDVICACMRSCCRVAFGSRFGFVWGVSTIALNVSITGQTLDRNIEKRGGKNFGGVWLVEGQILRTLKPVCVVLCTRSLRFKFDDPWMPCQTVGCMSMAGRALLGAWGLERPSSARACVSLPLRSHIWQPVWILV